ncbi:hypothetical protein [Streptomyces mirabilis]|uniref:hypothetical protein n=1 Tax=Streptomyces mirabilis TaxID=68239 RepID=UPI0033AEF5E7
MVSTTAAIIASARRTCGRLRHVVLGGVVTVPGRTNADWVRTPFCRRTPLTRCLRQSRPVPR